MSPVAVGYAIAIPVTVFLILLWALHALIMSRPVLRPTPMLGGSLVILLLPLVAPRIALAAVVTAISITCASIVAITIMSEQRRAHHVPRRRLVTSRRRAVRARG